MFNWLCLLVLLWQPIPELPHFKLYILQQNWWDLQLGYTLDQSWEVLQTVDLTKPAAVITEADLEFVDWDNQVFVLNQAATRRIATALELTSERDYFTNHDLYLYSFVVTLDDERLYGGTFLPAISAMGIDYPVIRNQLVDNYWMLFVDPRNGYRVEPPTLPKYQALEARIKLDSLYTFFEENKLLTE